VTLVSLAARYFRVLTCRVGLILCKPGPCARHSLRSGVLSESSPSDATGLRRRPLVPAPCGTRPVRPRGWVTVSAASGLNRNASSWALTRLSVQIPAYRRISTPIRDSAQPPKPATNRFSKPNSRREGDQERLYRTQEVGGSNPPSSIPAYLSLRVARVKKPDVSKPHFWGGAGRVRG
jgi:hypothetical protein